MESTKHRRFTIKHPVMEAQAILKANYLDIIFDNRNKSYGGYELRKNYQHRMSKALLAIVLLSALFSAVLLWPRGEVIQQVMPTSESIKITEVFFPEQILPPEPVGPPPPQEAATADYADPVIVADNETTSEMATVTELSDRQIGTENTEGIATHADIGGPVVNNLSGNGESTTAIPATTNEAVRYVEQMPEFEALGDYLTKHLRYPELAKENNIQGKVIVEFIVDEEGRIGQAVVKKGIGGGCDEEALRVIKNMPKWKAGRQNGKAVKVYLLLPIVFKLQ